MILIILLGILIAVFLTIILYSCLKVSSECSRLEEKEHINKLCNNKLINDATKASYTYANLHHSESL